MKIQYNITLDSKICCELTKSLIKHILYIRGHIPVPYVELENWAVRQQEDIIARKKSGKKRKLVAGVEKKAGKCAEQIKNAFLGFDTLFSQPSLPTRILFIFGTSLLSPKEMYMVQFSATDPSLQSIVSDDVKIAGPEVRQECCTNNAASAPIEHARTQTIMNSPPTVYTLEEQGLDLCSNPYNVSLPVPGHHTPARATRRKSVFTPLKTPERPPHLGVQTTKQKLTKGDEMPNFSLDNKPNSPVAEDQTHGKADTDALNKTPFIPMQQEKLDPMPEQSENKCNPQPRNKFSTSHPFCDGQLPNESTEKANTALGFQIFADNPSTACKAEEKRGKKNALSEPSAEVRLAQCTRKLLRTLIGCEEGALQNTKPISRTCLHILVEMPANQIKTLAEAEGSNWLPALKFVLKEHNKKKKRKDTPLMLIDICHGLNGVHGNFNSDHKPTDLNAKQLQRPFEKSDLQTSVNEAHSRHDESPQQHPEAQSNPAFDDIPKHTVESPHDIKNQLMWCKLSIKINGFKQS